MRVNIRNEGKYKDRVCAIPVEPNRLRLYCIRIDDGILILGNGGIKNVKKYQQDAELKKYVNELQALDKVLKQSELSNSTYYYRNTIYGNTEFRINTDDGNSK